MTRKRIALFAVVAASAIAFGLWWCRNWRRRVYFEFEFGATKESEAFFERHPKFRPAFERLMTLTNKCFGRAYHPSNRLEDVGFDLGHTCRADYAEILFLAVNGYGAAASKLVRGLYERAVALAYMVKHHEKAERFVRYAGVQEKKALDRALELVSEEDFDKAMYPNTAAQVRELYETVKPEFRVTDCKKCGTTMNAPSWDIDMTSMVRDVGDPYDKYFMGSYTIPTLHIHATLASVKREPDPEKQREQNYQAADFALVNATACLLFAIREQNKLFDLKLDHELEVCEKDVIEVFVTG